MASRRRQSARRTPLKGRRPPRQTSYSEGASVTFGRTSRRTSSLLLPRTVAPAFPALVWNTRFRPGAVARRPGRTVVQVVGTRGIQDPRRSPTIRRIERIARNPVIRTEDNSICRTREKRKEVMFAQGVAGRKWGRGGPNMKRARRSLKSQYTCVR